MASVSSQSVPREEFSWDLAHIFKPRGERNAMRRSKNSFFTCGTFAAAALAGFFMFVGAPHLRADDGCQSEQAERRRHELHDARERCWNVNHRWWDEHEHRWHTDHDWDDHDHDH